MNKDDNMTLLGERQRGIGGSDAPVVAGLSPYKSALRLYYEKRGELQIDEVETEAMRWGTVLEEPIAREYVERTGRKVRRQPMKTSTDHPFMLAHLDRQVMSDPRGPGVLEIKTVNAFKGKHYDDSAQLPDDFYLQGQHYLAVTGYRWCSFAILIGGQRFTWCDVERHDEVIAYLIELEAAFWGRVQSGNPPPADGSIATRDTLRHLYPHDSGKIITLQDAELVAYALTLHDLRRQERELEANKLEAENKLKAAMADASEAVIPGFGRLTWRTAAPSKKLATNLDRLRAEYPDAYAACVTTEAKGSGRRFLLHPDKALIPTTEAP